MNTKTHHLVLILFSALGLISCGSSGGNSEPPPPPAPVAPPPPPPEPTFEERLADLAAFDPNPCRASTPGFEALGGWLSNDGRELGDSRVWVSDIGQLDDPLRESHGARVWASFTACAVRFTEEQYWDGNTSDTSATEAMRLDGRDLIRSASTSPPYEDVPFPEPLDPRFLLPESDGAREDGQRILTVHSVGNDTGQRTGWLQNASTWAHLERHETALRIYVGGYEGEGEGREPASGSTSGSSLCSAADPLCLFAPWEAEGRDDSAVNFGTSHAAPQVSAALDTVWAVWPDMDILDLRNLAFDCAENMSAGEGDTTTERTYSYSNGRSFTSTTNSTWGHGILSLTCLFTPNGGLQNPVTGNPISGGIIGPIAGPVLGASIMGVDYTGRGFGYGFVRPVARENWALQALTRSAAVSASRARSPEHALHHGSGAYSATSWNRGDLRINLTAATPRGGGGKALGLVAEGQIAGLTVRTGVAFQPDGVGSLTGSRAFQAPATVSASLAVAYRHAVGLGVSAHLQAEHWRTVATRGRSLWEDAQLRESRLTAALVKRFGQHEISLQGIWRSGLSGTLDVDGRAWPVAPRAERGLWLTWNLR